MQSSLGGGVDIWQNTLTKPKNVVRREQTRPPRRSHDELLGSIK